MSPREVTEIVIDEHGYDTHPSWVRITANRSQVGGSMRLFDSEVNHRHIISVRVERCSRKRSLNSDFLYNTEKLLELAMSEAQWGAFVSSFGQGGGVPATLTWFGGLVPDAPFESRLDESHQEVEGAGEEALREIQDAFAAVETAFEEKAGRRVMGALIRDLHFKLENGPKNMKFAAKSLTEHVENVVTKARADIEAAVAAAGGQELLGDGAARLLGRGDDD